MSSYLGLLAVAASAVPTPPAGKVRFFLDSADGVPSFKDSAGAVTKITSADPELAAIAGLTSAADRGIVFTGSGTAALFTLSAFALTFLDDANQAAVRTTLGLTPGTDVQAFDADLTAIAALTRTRGDLIVGGASDWTDLALGTSGKSVLSDGTDVVWGYPSEVRIIAIGDETTAITTGTAKVTFRAPYACNVLAVRASLATVSSSGTPTFDINEDGTTILSTKLTIDVSEKTSTTAAVAAVISDAALADDAEITIDIDVAGTGAAGAKVALYLQRTS
jgi:hypothetical protein